MTVAAEPARLRGVALAVRYRRWIAGLLAALIGLLDRRTPLDLSAFADLGRLLLAGRLDEVYAGSFTQAGPVQLVVSRLLLAGGHDGMPPAPPRILAGVALTLGAMAACRGRPVREVAAGVLALLWLLGPVPWAGHPAEVAVPVLWTYAMILQRRDRWLAAGAVLGLAVLIAPVAVLGFPCLLAVGRPTRLIRTALAGAGVAVLGYLPFVLSGQFGMFGHVWPVDPGSLPHLLGMREVTWPMRAAQAVVVAGGCGLVAYLRRGQLAALAAAPLTAALLRVATDPLTFPYYWVPVAVGSVLLVALLPDDEPRWRQALAVILGYVTMLAATRSTAAAGAATCLAGYAVTLRWRRVR